MRATSTVIAALLLTLSLAPLSPAIIGLEQAGGTPAARPAAVTFTNVSSSTGLSAAYGNFLAWGDYDNDGCQDLLIQGSQLFKNGGPPGWGFTDVTVQAGLFGGFTSGTWGDFNNDGWLDFYAAGGQDRLYKNDGDGTFTDVTAAAGNVQDAYPSQASGWGDYNRDGFIDLYVANGEDWNNGNPIYYPDILWKNDGDGTFTDVTAAANVSEGNHPYYGRGVAWADFDNDGWLDLYVSNYRLSPNYLYVNDHDGTFTEMGKQLDCAGVYDPDKYYDSYTGRNWGPQYGHTIGSAWADFNNDGNLDLWTTNLVHKYVGLTGDPGMPYDIRGYVCDDSKMYQNIGAPYYNFSDIRSTSGIPTKPIGGSGTYRGDELFDGVAWGDYDNDADLDIWIPQVYDLDYAYSFLYEQDGNGNGSSHWTDRALELGMRVWNTYAGVWCDYNNDGTLDLLTAGKSPFVAEGQGTYALHLYKNSGNSNHWLEVNLAGSDCNRAAIGARVTVKAGNVTQIREVEGGMGCHGSQNSMVQHFGFYNRTTADWVEVQWPCGRIERFSDVGLNQTLKITESGLPVPRIESNTALPNPVAEDASVAFSASATIQGGSIQRYEWDFTSDNFWEVSNSYPGTAHTYTENGTVLASLRVWSTAGIGVKADPISITVMNLAPAAAAGNDRTADMDSEVSFNGSGSNDTVTDMKKGLEYNWTFGDGASRNWSKDGTANHTYTRPGVFNVRLTARDDDGAEGSAWMNVTVNEVPPTANAMSDRTAFEDEVVQFTGTGNDTLTDRPRLTFRWDFGDGNSTAYGSLPSASHAYTSKGNYSATFSVRDPSGLVSSAGLNVTVLNPAPSCSIGEEYLARTFNEDFTLGFDGTAADNPSDLPSLRFSWDFGDGYSTDWSAITSALHAYASQGVFNVTFTVKDYDNDTGTATTTVRINNVIPACEIITDEQAVEEDQQLEFEGTGQDSASDLPLLEYQWNFGDGNRTGWMPLAGTNHTYVSAGSYRVSLTVRDDEGATAASEPVFIEVADLPPRAVAEASPKTVDEDAMVNFTARASTDTLSDMPSLTYHWEFGDGDDDDGMNVSHAYTRSGSYTVKLRVVDNDGAFSEDSSIKIKVRNVPPTVLASADRTAGKTGEQFSFRANASDTPTDMPQLVYTWYFGDGAKAVGKAATHSYTAAGVYSVRVEVTDPEGEKAEAQLSIEVTQTKGQAPPPPGGPNYMLIGAAVAGAVVVAGVVILLLMRRKKGGPAAVDPPPPR